MNGKELATAIDALIASNKSFALYRLPGDAQVRFLQQKQGEVAVYTDISQLNGKDGFVIAPFRIADECPVLLIEGEEILLPIETEVVEDAIAGKEQYAAVSSAYKECYNIFSAALQTGSLEKLVLSRNEQMARKSSFSPYKTFRKACKCYTRSYVYLCHTPQSGTWIGSTPEIILAGEGENWHTVALAGTQIMQGEVLPTAWDEKNSKEQRLVSDYIRQCLDTFGLPICEEGPHAVRAGQLAHLRSDFRFILKERDKLGDLLALLHPTPAVCGLPKNDSYRFIRMHEGYDRRYYSGFIGRINRSGRSDIYVNLRCMHVDTSTLTLYAGGGLLASSDLQEEWRETEDKLYTMRAII
ncbi:isochorismate synthase [Bacteroides sp. 214]|uniref:isochorismate synthase n=1 Tax=Bacteroides sp. 214 TaxID=2302935 RepID=UPI0013D133AA|nr:isochorismate synthase [Bacteroides sp. 214]NDW12384.1 isochorismate synthase [Bacteroides sp. 214]